MSLRGSRITLYPNDFSDASNGSELPTHYSFRESRSMLVSMPVSAVGRVCVLAAAIAASAVSAGAQANRANQAQLRWYDAYNQAERAVQKRDWATAERLL